MRTSDAGIRMLKHHEGVRRRPYLCPAFLHTVGVGHLLYPEQVALPALRTPENVGKPLRKEYPLRPEDNRVWTDAEVDDLLAQDLVRFERGVARLCPAAVDRQSHFDALVSFAFNVGLGNLQRSSVRMRYNRGDVEGAAEGLLMWTKGGGRVLPGLVKRRGDERKLLLT
jgi:GH24 family phage-related lysozyme (muramidase)